MSQHPSDRPAVTDTRSRQDAPAGRRRLASLAPIVVFDIAGPLAAYYGMRSAGLSTVTALIASGALPAIGIALGVARSRQLDAVGAVVLIGIVVGTIVGAASGSAHLVLLDGVIPTATFAVVCLASLWSTRPLIFRFALEGMGADTTKGRDFADLWRYPGFRHTFRVITIVWGLAFLAEAVVQVAIVETASAGVAKTTSNLLPLAVAAVVVAWNIAYGKSAQRRGQRAAQEAAARGEPRPAMPE